MLKVIDLDNAGKDGDGLIFTLTIGTEKFGITDQELVEMIRAKNGATSTKSSAKRTPQRRGAQAADSQVTESSAAAEAELEANAEDLDSTPGETQAAL